MAAQVFGVERDQVTHAQRSTAKMVSYGLAYGMEAYGLSQRLGVSVEEAQGILQAFFAAFPSVNAYMETAVSDARAAGYTVTAFGRRRPLPDLVSTNYQVRQAAERQAMNAGIQGLAADLFKLALIRLDSGLEEQRTRLRPGPAGPRRGLVGRGGGRRGPGGRPHRGGPDRSGRAHRAAQGGHGLGLLVGRGQRRLTGRARCAARAAVTSGVRLTPGHDRVTPTFTADPATGCGDLSGKRATYLHV